MVRIRKNRGAESSRQGHLDYERDGDGLYKSVMRTEADREEDKEEWSQWNG